METLSQARSLPCSRNIRSRSHSSTASRLASTACSETLSRCGARSIGVLEQNRMQIGCIASVLPTVNTPQGGHTLGNLIDPENAPYSADQVCEQVTRNPSSVPSSNANARRQEGRKFFSARLRATYPNPDFPGTNLRGDIATRRWDHCVPRSLPPGSTRRLRPGRRVLSLWALRTELVRYAPTMTIRSDFFAASARATPSAGYAKTASRGTQVSRSKCVDCGSKDANRGASF